MKKTSKYGVYVFKVGSIYHIFESLQDVKGWYKLPSYYYKTDRKWASLRVMISRRHKFSFQTKEIYQLFPDDISHDDIYIMAYDAFIKDLGHEIYLTKKWGGEPHKQRVFYHKKGDKGYEIV